MREIERRQDYAYMVSFSDRFSSASQGRRGGGFVDVNGLCVLGCVCVVKGVAIEQSIGLNVCLCVSEPAAHVNGVRKSRTRSRSCHGSNRFFFLPLLFFSLDHNFFHLMGFFSLIILLFYK